MPYIKLDSGKQPIKNKLIIYGIDFMNNEQTKKQFSEGGIKII